MSLKKIFKNYYLETILILIIFFLDRISKLFVIHLDKLNFNSEIYSSKFLNIHLIWNEGIAFGLFSFNENYLYNGLTFLIFLVIIFIIFMIKKSNPLRKYALLLVLSGALGNFFDRLIYKAVPDFIDLHIGNFHWFIFNVADIFITFGIFFMIRKSDPLRKYALLLVLGGALGNFFDRIIYKAVPDFIDFHVGNFHWFIFNVSDIFITIGIILMIIIEIINKPEATNNEKI